MFAVIFSMIAVLAAVLCGVYVLYLRRQIDDICRQMAFIDRHDSNKRIAVDTRDAAILRLTACINALEDEKRRVKTQAQLGERNFKDTISGISHDIRTPLTSLYGYFQMLQNALAHPDSDGQPIEKYIRIMDGRIHELQDMTEQLFTFVKLENPSYVLDCGEVNLTQTLCDVLFSFYDDIGQNGLEPKVDIPGEIYTVSADAAALRRVLQNIIKNALIHGERELFVNMADSSEWTQGVEIAVGNRIPPDSDIDLSRIFEKFYKVDSSRHKSGSTGLGLFIARSLVERMGGQIRAETDGDTFTIKVLLKKMGR